MNDLKHLSRAIVLRPNHEWRAPLDRAWFFVLVSLLTLVMILSLPISVSYLYSTPLKEGIPWLKDNQIWINEWVSSLRLIFEILTAICIGGTFFAKSRANSIENRLQNYEANLLLKTTELMDKTEATIYRRFELMHILLSEQLPKSPIKHRLRLLLESYRTLSLVEQTIRRTNTRPIAVMVLISFPGGLYGLFAFAFLFSVCICKLLQIYMAMLPQT